MTRPNFFALLVCASAVGMGSVAVAETRVLLVRGQLDEAISDRAKTSGSLIVGLQIGPSEGTFRPEQLRLRIHPAVKGRQVCVKLSSRDGRYRGIASYEINQDAVPAPQLEYNSRYLSEQRFPSEQLAARAVLSSRCDDGAFGPLVPMQFGPLPLGGDHVLYAYVNPGDARVSARLVHGLPDDWKLEERRCDRLTGGISIAFSHRCEIKLPARPFAGPASLELKVSEPAGIPVIRSFQIELPRKE